MRYIMQWTQPGGHDDAMELADQIHNSANSVIRFVIPQTPLNERKIYLAERCVKTVSTVQASKQRKQTLRLLCSFQCG